MALIDDIAYLFKAPDPITTAPAPVKEVGRVNITAEPLNLIQKKELFRSISQYNEFLDSWLPHVRKLTKMTAMYPGEGSGKWFHRALIDIELDGKYYRMEVFIKRYQRDIRTVVEITNQEFNRPKTIVFSNDIIRGHS